MQFANWPSCHVNNVQCDICPDSLHGPSLAHSIALADSCAESPIYWQLDIPFCYIRIILSCHHLLLSPSLHRSSVAQPASGPIPIESSTIFVTDRVSSAPTPWPFSKRTRHAPARERHSRKRSGESLAEELLGRVTAPSSDQLISPDTSLSASAFGIENISPDARLPNFAAVYELSISSFE